MNTFKMDFIFDLPDSDKLIYISLIHNAIENIKNNNLPDRSFKIDLDKLTGFLCDCDNKRKTLVQILSNLRKKEVSWQEFNEETIDIYSSLIGSWKLSFSVTENDPYVIYSIPDILINELLKPENISKLFQVS